MTRLKTIVALLFSCALMPLAYCAGQGDETAAPPVPVSANAPASADATPAAKPPAPEAASPAPAASETPAPAKTEASANSEASAAPSHSAASGGTSKRYVIGPLDVLMIKVWNQPQLSGAVDVNSDGMISLALIGEVKADGLTAIELKEDIAKRLTEFVKNPEVTVDVAKVNSKRYFVYGGVLRAGEFPLIEKTTIMDALSEVGGFKDFAKTKKIRIQRGAQTFYFNYNDFSKGKNMDKNVNIELQNGDRIYVPE